MKIDDMDIDGEVKTTTLSKYNYDRVVVSFKGEHIDLPKLRMRNRNAYRILLDPVRVKYEFDGYRYDILFKRGYIWDLSSTPGIIKALKDNDDPRTEIASMIHDYMFGIQPIGFRDVNRMYYWISRYFDLPVPLGALEWLGISSLVGRIRWWRYRKSRLYMLDFVEYKSTKII